MCTPTTASKSSSLIFTRVRSRMMPALLTRMSILPNSSTAVLMMPSAASKSLTESYDGTAAPPSDSISLHTCAAGSSSVPRPSRLTPTSFTTTLAPSRARHRAMSRPMPRPDPVTTATRSSSSIGGTLPGDRGQRAGHRVDGDRRRRRSQPAHLRRQLDLDAAATREVHGVVAMQSAHAAGDRVEVVDDRASRQRVAQRARNPRRQLAVAPTEEHPLLGPPPWVPLRRRLPVHPERVGAVAVHRHHDVDVVEEGGQLRRGGRRVPPRRDVPAQVWWLHHGVERRTRALGRLGGDDVGDAILVAAVQGHEPERRSKLEVLLDAGLAQEPGEHAVERHDSAPSPARLPGRAMTIWASARRSTFSPAVSGSSSTATTRS